MVPHDLYSGLMSKQEQTFSPLVGQLANLDQEMHEILSNPSLTPNAKYQMYQQVFSRYQHLKNQQFPTKAPMNPVQVTTQTLEPEPQKIDEDYIVSSLPKTARRRGRILLEHMKKRNNQFQFLPSGEIIDKRGQPIPGSNITDLVHHVTRHRPSVSAPIGSEIFIDFLSETNVPREALNMEEDSKFMTPGTLGTSFAPMDTSTPKSIQSSLKKTSLSSRVKKVSKVPVRKRQKPIRYGNWVEY